MSKAMQTLVFALLIAVVAAGAATQQDRINTPTVDNSQIAPLITTMIDDGHLVTLPGNTRPEANAKNDRGRVEDAFRLDHMILQLRRSRAQEQALDDYIDQLHDPASPHFHQWLTAQQLGEKYGIAQVDIDKITGWLKSHGFSVNSVAPTRMTIDFSGTAGQVRRAFHTEIHKLQVEGVEHIANMRDPRIPAALAPAVAGIVSLHDFKPHPMHVSHADYTFGGCSGSCYILAPTDLATIYNLNPLFTKGYSGQGQTIVLIEDTDVYSTNDWDTFRSTFGLSTYPSGSFTQVHPNSTGNACTDPGTTGNDGEATLDVEWASAAAPSASIELASCADTATNFGGFIALQNLLNSSTPPTIVSISYGESETNDGAAFNASISSMYEQAVSEGVSVFVSAGDAAAALADQGCTSPCAAQHGINVNGWGSTIYNVAVGGTDFGDTASGTNSTYWSSTNTGTYGSALSYIPEIPWNNSCASVLLATFEGFTTTYGTGGFCNSSTGSNFLNVTGGSGGPSACATGVPGVPGVVGGTCAGYSKPTWQSLFGNPSDGVRDLPDVSLFAANGIWGHSYVYCFSDPSNHGSPCTGAPSGWSFAGGTSFAAPIMAAIQALVNQYTGTKWGNPNPTYYSLATSEYGASGDSTCNSSNGNTIGSSCIFYDVTEGDMDVPCVANSGTLYNCYLPSGTYGVLSTSNSAYQPAYGTQIGWDFATGIGTVNAYNLATNFSPKTATTTTLAFSQATVAVGTSLTLKATIAPAPPNGETVTFVDTTSGSTLGTGTTASGTASFTSATIAGGTYNIEAKYPGDSTLAPSISAASALNVQDFTLNPTTLTINVPAPGQNGSGTINLGLLGGLTQAPTFSCSGLPSESTCTFTAASATAELVTIGTTASSWLHDGPFGRGNGMFYALLFPGLLGAILSAGSRNRRARAVLVLLALLAVLTLWLPACGGSSTPHNPGTPVGQSNVTVTATQSSITHTVAVTLNVQ